MKDKAGIFADQWDIDSIGDFLSYQLYCYF